MSLDPSPDDLVAVVSWLMGAQGTEHEQGTVYRYLARHLPDPEWSDIIFWPSHHPETRAMGIDSAWVLRVLGGLVSQAASA